MFESESKSQCSDVTNRNFPCSRKRCSVPASNSSAVLPHLDKAAKEGQQLFLGAKFAVRGRHTQLGGQPRGPALLNRQALAIHLCQVMQGASRADLPPLLACGGHTAECISHLLRKVLPAPLPVQEIQQAVCYGQVCRSPAYILSTSAAAIQVKETRKGRGGSWGTIHRN